MAKKISVITISLMIIQFCCIAGAETTTVKCGTAFSSFQPSYGEYEFSDDGVIILGDGYKECKMIYRFYFPPPNGSREVTTLEIDISGSGDVTTVLFGGYDFGSFSDFTSWGFSLSSIRDMLQSSGDGVGGYYIEIEIDVLNKWGGLNPGDRYELEKIVVRYDYSGVPSTYVHNFVEAYSGYLAISEYASKVDTYWGTDAVSDQFFLDSTRLCYAFASIFTGLDTSTPSQTALSFANALQRVFDLGDLFQAIVDGYWDHIEFMSEYYWERPDGVDIEGVCNSATTELGDLANAWKNLAFDGEITGADETTILQAIVDTSDSLGTLQNNMDDATNGFKGLYYLYQTRGSGDEGSGDGDIKAEMLLNSFAPLIWYDYDMTTQPQAKSDSFLLTLIDSISEQPSEFGAGDISTAVEDANVKETTPNTNYGDSTTLLVSREVGGAYSHGLVKFDLSYIPTGDIVDSVELRLSVSDYPTSVYEHLISIRQIQGSWSEYGVTWNNMPLNLAAPPSGDPIICTYIDQGDIPVWTWDSGTYPDLITLVQDWVDNPGSNYGISVVGHPGNPGVTFYSREEPNPSLKPKLLVSHSTPAPPIGSLTVIIQPTEVQGSGQWRLATGPDTNWKSSGDTITDILTGPYSLQFQDVSGWKKPASRSITVAEGNNSEQGTYIRLPVINNVAPLEGPPGTFMQIDGQYFGSTTGNVIFTGGSMSEILSWNENQILCRVTSGAMDGDMAVVKVGDAASVAANFDVTDPSIIYVNHIHTPNIENGTTQYPFSTIQRGIEAATSGDEIIITADTYSEDVSCGAGIELHFTGDSTIDGQFTTGTGSDVISDGNLAVVGIAQLGGDVNTVTSLTFQASVTAHGTDQLFDAGTGTLLAVSAITKTTAGNLTLSGDTLVDLDGIVDVQNGSLTIEDAFQAAANLQASVDVTSDAAATFDGSVGQTMQAVGGTLWAKNTISKTTPGSLILGGGTQIDLDGAVTSEILQLNGDTVVASGLTLAVSVDFVVADGKSLIGEGPLTLDAGDNITLGGTTQAAGKLTVSAVSDMLAKDTVTTTSGDIEIWAADTTIDLDGDVAADGNLLLNNNTIVAPSRTLSAGSDVILSDGKTLTGEGALTVDAANDITLGGTTQSGTLILTADSDANGTGNVELKDSVTLTSGSFTSSGIDFNNPNSPVTTNGGNIAVNHDGIVTLGEDLNPNGGTVSGTATQVIVTPLGKIQDGIDVSSPVEIGDIMVQSATYTGPDNIDIDFRGKALTLHSGSGPESCIIDCNQQGRGFYFHSGEDHNSILDGFTIIDGYSDEWPAGAGIFCSSSPIITHCTIIGCWAGGWSDGGGIVVQDSGPEFNGCIVVANSAWYGGGIYCYGGNTRIRNSLIAGNYAIDLYGGGVCCSSGNLSISESTLVGNFSENAGGAIACRGSEAEVKNCIIWDNVALWGSGIYVGPPGELSTVTISYSDVQDGRSGVHVVPTCTLNWGVGNIDVNPGFVSPGYWDPWYWINGDYHLLPDSLCIDAGDPNYMTDANDFDIDGNPRVIGGRIDMGFDEYNPDKFPDFDGNKIVNFVDFAILASYWTEYSCAWPDWCQGSDLDESGGVDSHDQRIFVDYWLEQEPIRFHYSPLDTDPCWPTSGEWAFGEPNGQGGSQHGNPDPSKGYTRSNVYGVNLNGDYDHTTTGGPYYVTTEPFDCSLYKNVNLKFARWLNTDDPAYVESTVEVSNNGTSWAMVWEHTERAEITDDSWRIVKYDISSVADEQATVYIRWGYEILPEAYPYSGWNIDDLELWGNPK